MPSTATVEKWTKVHAAIKDMQTTDQKKAWLEKNGIPYNSYITARNKVLGVKLQPKNGMNRWQIAAQTREANKRAKMLGKPEMSNGFKTFVQAGTTPITFRFRNGIEATVDATNTEAIKALANMTME